MLGTLFKGLKMLRLNKQILISPRMTPFLDTKYKMSNWPILLHLGLLELPSLH